MAPGGSGAIVGYLTSLLLLSVASATPHPFHVHGRTGTHVGCLDPKSAPPGDYDIMVPLELHPKRTISHDRRYTLHLNTAESMRKPQFAFILRSAPFSIGVDAAVFYRAAEGTDQLQAEAFHARTDPRVPDVRVALGTAACTWLDGLRTPVHGHAAEDSRHKHLERFPEVLQFGLGRLLVIPCVPIGICSAYSSTRPLCLTLPSRRRNANA